MVDRGIRYVIYVPIHSQAKNFVISDIQNSYLLLFDLELSRRQCYHHTQILLRKSAAFAACDIIQTPNIPN